MVKIQKGSILIYRLFDVAEEINLSKVEELLKSDSNGSRLKFTRSPRQAVIMRNAPVTLSLGESSLALQDQEHKVEAFAKIWDYGVMSIQFQVAIEPGTGWEDLINMSAKMEQDTLIDEAARFRTQELVNILAPALRDQHSWHEFEDYVIFFFEELNGVGKCSDLINSVDAARLIVAENTVTLSEKAKKVSSKGLFNTLILILPSSTGTARLSSSPQEEKKFQK